MDSNFLQGSAGTTRLERQRQFDGTSMMLPNGRKCIYGFLLN